jgi:hypothetical protein
MATETRQQQGLAALADLMNRRRLELGKRWEDVAADGHLSIKTLRDIRSGNGGFPRALTLRRIDDGLQWKPGSAERAATLKGDPEPAGDRAEPGGVPLPAVVSENWGDPRVRALWEIATIPAAAKAGLITYLLKHEPAESTGALSAGAALCAGDGPQVPAPVARSAVQ